MHPSHPELARTGHSLQFPVRPHVTGHRKSPTPLVRDQAITGHRRSLPGGPASFVRHASAVRPLFFCSRPTVGRPRIFCSPRRHQEIVSSFSPRHHGRHASLLQVSPSGGSAPHARCAPLPTTRRSTHIAQVMDTHGSCGGLVAGEVESTMVVPLLSTVRSIF
jgi:hypothetical protein